MSYIPMIFQVSKRNLLAKNCLCSQSEYPHSVLAAISAQFSQYIIQRVKRQDTLLPPLIGNISLLILNEYYECSCRFYCQSAILEYIGMVILSTYFQEWSVFEEKNKKLNIVLKIITGAYNDSFYKLLLSIIRVQINFT